MGVLKAVHDDDETFKAANGSAETQEGIFERNAHERLIGIDRPLTWPRGLKQPLLKRAEEEVRRSQRPRD
jgi:hypothetical protein